MSDMTPRERMRRAAQSAAATAPPNPFLSPGATVGQVPESSVGGTLQDLARVLDLDDPDRPEQDGVPLFTLDGVVYSIPADPPASFVLKYLSAIKEGVLPDAAAGALLSELLGEQAYAALATSPKVRLSDFMRIMEIVKIKVLGPALDGLGK